MNDRAFRQFICRACGYIYDEALGDPDGGLPPGTRFEDIPDDWMCPTCGVGKAEFEPHVASSVPPGRATAAPAPQRGGADPVIIVGAGLAAWSVARALRASDPELPIMMVSGCRGDLYSKPMLSVACAQNKAPEQLVTTPGTVLAAELNVRLQADTWLVGIDCRRRSIRTTRGTWRYRHLVLATGATPAPLPLDEQSQSCIWRINHLEQYAAFRQRLAPAGENSTTHRDIVIIGAGLVGCELADDLASHGHRVTLVEAAAQPLSGLATPQAAVALVDAFSRAGIRMHTGTRVVSVRNTGAGYLVQCSDGMISADIVLAATGLRTDGRIAKAAGLAFDNGYAVDALTMCTSDPQVFALGDCASFDGVTHRFIEPIRRQADVVAARILDRPCAGFQPGQIPVRLKSRTSPMTFHSAA